MTTKSITIAKGNTYNAKDYLKEAGFTWDSILKRWTIATENFDHKEWISHYCSLSYYGSKKAKWNRAVEFETI